MLVLRLTLIRELEEVTNFLRCAYSDGERRLLGRELLLGQTYPLLSKMLLEVLQEQFNRC